MTQEEILNLNIDGIMTDINNKAETDLVNVNSSGTSKSAGWAMPSNTYDELTLGASGSQYTAPANGYFAAQIVEPSNSWCNIQILDNNGIEIYVSTIHPTASGYNQADILPVRKGYKCAVSYNNITSVSFFRFIYAVGSENEYSPD